ncbi:MAG: UbiD family decarboxylase [Acidobacteria bacterium]|nr:UbiD family decarboxylase [Acidobacteriota bacterium]
MKTVEAKEQQKDVAQSQVFRSLRDFLEFLDEQGQLRIIKGADWNLELGGLTELVWRKKLEDSPALLFDEIKGYPPGFRVLTLGVATTYRYTAASHLRPTKDRRQAITALRDQVAPVAIPPRVVSSGPVLENVVEKEKIDLATFPAPKYKEGEGGRFIGTGDVVITRDADTGLLNAGTYRVQIQGPNKVSAHMAPGRHGRIHVESFHRKGKPAPIVISVGQSPDLFLAACERFGKDVDELEMVGGRRGEPVDVVLGELTRLPIPATAEIVLEGFIYPDAEKVNEGPFGEFMGYYAGAHEQGHPEVSAINIERVYYRSEPIIFGLPHHRPPQDVVLEYRLAPRLWKELLDAGIPGIHEVNSLPFGSGMVNVISMRTQYAGHSTQVAMHAASSQTGYLLGHITIVVDEDVDVYDQDMVFWAVLTRCDPSRHLHVINNMVSFTLDPLTHDPLKYPVGDTTRARLVIDATKPFHWKNRFPRTTDLRSELKEQLLKKWERDLFRIL